MSPWLRRDLRPETTKLLAVEPTLAGSGATTSNAMDLEPGRLQRAENLGQNKVWWDFFMKNWWFCGGVKSVPMVAGSAPGNQLSPRGKSWIMSHRSTTSNAMDMWVAQNDGSDQTAYSTRWLNFFKEFLCIFGRGNTGKWRIFEVFGLRFNGEDCFGNGSGTM